MLRPQDAVSTFISAKLSSHTLQLLKLLKWYRLYRMGDEEVRAAFVADLNRIIQKEEIYDAYRFNHVSLRSLVTESLGNTVAPERRAQINRLLLEDAFPTALSRASDRHIK